MNTQEQAQLEEKMSEFIIGGGTMHALYGITEEELEALYTKGFQEYNAQQYDKAMESLAYLVYLKPDETRYLFAFGALLQAVKEYKKAIYYYLMAANQDISNPTITLHIVECLIALEMQDDALAALDILLQETATNPNWSGLHAKALAYHGLLMKKQAVKQ